MSKDETLVFNVNDLENFMIKETLDYTSKALVEKGYNSINQIVGYLMSGDPGYISNHKEARNKIMKLDRTKIIEMMVRNYMSK